MTILIALEGLRFGETFGDSRMRNVQCNVDFGHQLMVCSRTEEKNGKLWSRWTAARLKGSILTTSLRPGFQIHVP
jgi:hypothetical protein